MKVLKRKSIKEELDFRTNKRDELLRRLQQDSSTSSTCTQLSILEIATHC